MSLEAYLVPGARELGLELDAEQVGLFGTYIDCLERWSGSLSLTSISGEREIAVLHFLDSLTIARHLREPATLLDIGSGAGFPGVPLRIALPGLDVTLLEAREKKVFFLRDLIRRLGLDGIRAVWGRAERPHEELGRTFDYVAVRSLAGTLELTRLARPYLGTGGRLVLMRGREPGGEELRRGLAGTGFDLVETVGLALPILGHERTILVLERVP